MSIDVSSVPGNGGSGWFPLGFSDRSFCFNLFHDIWFPSRKKPFCWLVPMCGHVRQKKIGQYVFGILVPSRQSFTLGLQ